MGNFISLSHWHGCNARPVSIFGKPKEKIGNHAIKPLIRIYTNSSATLDQNIVTYPTTEPIGGDLVI